MILVGDVREQLSMLAACSVQCVITSPPYWGLRDYGTAEWEGGDAGCDHRHNIAQGEASSATIKTGQANNTPYVPMGDWCTKCGARRIDSQLGLEPTIDEYIANMVAVFRDVRRVLRDDGTLWLNIANSYDPPNGVRHPTKTKDLIPQAWLLALALQADGWYLRSDIIWAKPNPMPESVTDRPTKSHEYLFLMAKAERYYYDADAVRETGTKEPGPRLAFTSPRAQARGRQPSGNEVEGIYVETGYRNKRDVWTIATQPYPEAHFATFPEALVRPCVRAGTSEKGCCAECGAPWVREVERHRNGRDWNANNRNGGDRLTVGQSASDSMSSDYRSPTTTGWRPSCECVAGYVELNGQRYPRDHPVVPCVVLDPFMGSGTTGKVAHEEGRKFIGIELNPEYAEMARRRIDALQMQLAL